MDAHSAILIWDIKNDKCSSNALMRRAGAYSSEFICSLFLASFQASYINNILDILDESSFCIDERLELKAGSSTGLIFKLIFFFFYSRVIYCSYINIIQQ